jgi:hypothetical protein
MPRDKFEKLLIRLSTHSGGPRPNATGSRPNATNRIDGSVDASPDPESVAVAPLAAIRNAIFLPWRDCLGSEKGLVPPKCHTLGPRRLRPVGSRPNATPDAWPVPAQMPRKVAKEPARPDATSRGGACERRVSGEPFRSWQQRFAAQMLHHNVSGPVRLSPKTIDALYPRSPKPSALLKVDTSGCITGAETSPVRRPPRRGRSGGGRPHRA